MTVEIYTKQEVDQALAALAAQIPAPGSGGVGFRSYGVVDFYRSSQTFMPSQVGTAWTFSGSSLTGQTVRLPLDHGLDPAGLEYARFIVTWRPNVPAGVGGVRLVHCDDGPVNVTEIAKFERADPNPVPNAADVTAALRAMMAAAIAAGKTHKHLGVQMHGNGTTAVELFSAALELVWN